MFLDSSECGITFHYDKETNIPPNIISKGTPKSTISFDTNLVADEDDVVTLEKENKKNAERKEENEKASIIVESPKNHVSITKIQEDDTADICLSKNEEAFQSASSRDSEFFENVPTSQCEVAFDTVTEKVTEYSNPENVNATIQSSSSSVDVQQQCLLEGSQSKEGTKYSSPDNFNETIHSSNSLIEIQEQCLLEKGQSKETNFVPFVKAKKNVSENVNTLEEVLELDVHEKEAKLETPIVNLTVAKTSKMENTATLIVDKQKTLTFENEDVKSKTGANEQKAIKNIEPAKGALVIKDVSKEEPTEQHTFDSRALIAEVKGRKSIEERNIANEKNVQILENLQLVPQNKIVSFAKAEKQTEPPKLKIHVQSIETKQNTELKHDIVPPVPEERQTQPPKQKSPRKSKDTKSKVEITKDKEELALTDSLQDVDKIPDLELDSSDSVSIVNEDTIKKIKKTTKHVLSNFKKGMSVLEMTNNLSEDEVNVLRKPETQVAFFHVAKRFAHAPTIHNKVVCEMAQNNENTESFGTKALHIALELASNEAKPADIMTYFHPKDFDGSQMKATLCQILNEANEIECSQPKDLINLEKKMNKPFLEAIESLILESKNGKSVTEIIAEKQPKETENMQCIESQMAMLSVVEKLGNPNVTESVILEQMSSNRVGMLNVVGSKALISFLRENPYTTEEIMQYFTPEDFQHEQVKQRVAKVLNMAQEMNQAQVEEEI